MGLYIPSNQQTDEWTFLRTQSKLSTNAQQQRKNSEEFIKSHLPSQELRKISIKNAPSLSGNHNQPVPIRSKIKYWLRKVNKHANKRQRKLKKRAVLDLSSEHIDELIDYFNKENNLMQLEDSEDDDSDEKVFDEVAVDDTKIMETVYEDEVAARFLSNPLNQLEFGSFQDIIFQNRQLQMQQLAEENKLLLRELL